MTQKNRGFVAITSVIIISGILLILLYTLGASSFFNRFDALDAENKRTSLGIAEACVNAAMLRIAQSLPTTNVCVNTLGGTCGGADPQKVCKICSVTSSGNYATTTVRAVYNKAYSNLTVGLNVTPGSYAVLTWSETATADPACTVP